MDRASRKAVRLRRSPGLFRCVDPGGAVALRARWASVIGSLLATFLLGATQLIRAQEASPSRFAATPPAHLSIDNFPLEPAPEAAAASLTLAPSAADLGSQPPQDTASPDPSIDVKAIRLDTASRLRLWDPATARPGSTAVNSSAGSGSQPGIPQARELLLERQQRLEEYDQAAEELQKLTDPHLSPDRQLAASRLELERLQVQLAQPSQTALPRPFRISTKEVTDATRGEMKDAIEAVKTELKEWQAKFEEGRVQETGAGTAQQSLRADRDKLFQEVAALRTRTQKPAKASSAAQTPRDRQLEQERLVDLKLLAMIEALRLKVVEAKLTQELKRAEIRQVHQRELEAHEQLAQRQLEQMQRRYRELAEFQRQDLEKAAATQASKARQSGDPLDRYRAGRQADLLGLEARIVKHEQALATGNSPALEEQRALADRAEADFAEIKRLLADGNVSRLDALRLTNDFRRIGPERDRLLRNELATIEAQLQYYENVLTNVELELIEDSMAEQFEHDAVLERLAEERRVQARTAFAEIDQKRRSLLARQKAALSGLVARTAQTLEQVNRRLHVLEDEYGFIRTHIFWVRDQESIGLETVARAGRELKRLGKAMIKLAEEAGDRKLWRQPPSEFMTAAVAAVILPLGLFRLRRLLRRRITRALPPSHLHGGQTEAVRVDIHSVIRRS